MSVIFSPFPSFLWYVEFGLTGCETDKTEDDNLNPQELRQFLAYL
jgi:hypothetical protein